MPSVSFHADPSNFDLKFIEVQGHRVKDFHGGIHLHADPSNFDLKFIDVQGTQGPGSFTEGHILSHMRAILI